jgi:hypothetical protein
MRQLGFAQVLGAALMLLAALAQGHTGAREPLDRSTPRRLQQQLPNPASNLLAAVTARYGRYSLNSLSQQFSLPTRAIVSW